MISRFKMFISTLPEMHEETVKSNRSPRAAKVEHNFDEILYESKRETDLKKNTADISIRWPRRIGNYDRRAHSMFTMGNSLIIIYGID